MNKEIKHDGNDEPPANYLVEDEEIDDKDGEEKSSIIEEKCPNERFVRFNEEIGCGAHKIVYRAYDNDTGCEVAWNVIKLQNIPKKDRKKIDQEIDILKNIMHPNIIHYIHAWVNNKKEEAIFITEIVTGGSLKNYLKKIRQPRIKIIKQWCKEVLLGLQFLHTYKPHPIIHRDIKCENIFINSNKNEIRIGDLGLATFFNKSFTTSVLGTPEFMAPEIYEEKYGTGCDIYSFGMAVLEMATLQTPYKECSNPAQIYKKVIDGKRPQALDLILNEEIKKFIMKCLLDKDNRPSASELLQDPFLNTDSEADNQPVKLVPASNEDMTVSTPLNNQKANAAKKVRGPDGKLKEQEDDDSSNPTKSKQEDFHSNAENPSKSSSRVENLQGDQKEKLVNAEKPNPNILEQKEKNLTEQKEKIPLTEQREKIPLTEQREKIPLTDQKEKSGPAEQKENPGASEQKEKSNSAEQKVKPTSGEQVPTSNTLEKGLILNENPSNTTATKSSGNMSSSGVLPSSIPQVSSNSTSMRRLAEERLEEDQKAKINTSQPNQKSEEKPVEGKDPGLLKDSATKVTPQDEKALPKAEEQKCKAEDLSESVQNNQQTPLKPISSNSNNPSRKTEDNMKGIQMCDSAELSEERKNGIGNSNCKDGEPCPKDFSHLPLCQSDKSSKSKRKNSSNMNHDVEKTLDYSDDKGEEIKLNSNNTSNLKDYSKKKNEFLIKLTNVQNSQKSEGKINYTFRYVTEKTKFEFFMELDKKAENNNQVVEDAVSKHESLSNIVERKKLVESIMKQIFNPMNDDDRVSNTSSRSFNESDNGQVTDSSLNLEPIQLCFDKFYTDFLSKAYTTEFLENEKEEDFRQRQQMEREELEKIHKEQMNKFKEEYIKSSKSEEKIQAEGGGPNHFQRPVTKTLTATNSPKESPKEGNLNNPTEKKPSLSSRPVMRVHHGSLCIQPSALYQIGKGIPYLDPRPRDSHENLENSPLKIEEDFKKHFDINHVKHYSPVESIEDLAESKNRKPRGNSPKTYRKDLNIDLSHEKDYYPKRDALSQSSTPVQTNQALNQSAFNQNDSATQGQLLSKSQLINSISMPNNLNQAIKLQQQQSPVYMNGQSALVDKIKNYQFVGPLKLSGSHHGGTPGGSEQSVNPNEEEEVKMVQRCLKLLIDNNMEELGHYGTYTQTAVTRYQKEYTPTLKADGIVTTEVWESMKSSLFKKLIKNEEEEKKIKIEETKKINKKKQNQESEKALSKLESDFTKGEFL